MGEADTQIQDPITVELVNDREKISALIDQILDQAVQAGLKDAAIFAVRLAIEEAITNAFVHGHEHVPGDPPIRVEYKVLEREIQIAIEDHGPGFVPTEVPDPTLMENLSKPFGRGVMLMKAYMTEVMYNAKGNRVKMRYIAS
ncbi:MAG: ATP-binding protein [Phycisphaerales bacterium]|nr:ATP-binding protein [Phycisphaerales bacterium]